MTATSTTHIITSSFPSAMEPLGDFAAAQKSLTSTLVAATRTVASIAGEDIAFHRSVRPEVAASLDQKSLSLLRLTENLLHRSTNPPSIRDQQISLPDADSIDLQWKKIIDVADGLLENADKCLDQFTGLVKPNPQANLPSVQGTTPRKGPLGGAFQDAEIPKPQLMFDHPSFNYAKGPFKPLLSSKPNAITSYGESFKLIEADAGIMSYKHPYEDEINAARYPDRLYDEVTPQMFQPFDNTQATFVDTLEGVDQMLQVLKTADEIAIDLEHHDKHSYIGLVSLMQISTREHDWIVDTLKPWRRQLERLNEVFTDPNITKVLHGSHSDIVWLQRDFGLYIVGLFDTYDASRVLTLPGAGLAFLLKKYVNFDAQKQYQTADWRIRPIPKEMLDYARSDTHFLLYIYDCMRQELKQQSTAAAQLIPEVLSRSRETALQRFEFPTINDDITSRRNGWASILCRNPVELDKSQVAALKQVYHWRDAVARQEDENPFLIMSNATVLAIAKIRPKNKSSLLQLSHPISPILRARAEEVLEITRTDHDTSRVPDAAAIFLQFPARRQKALRRFGRDMNGETVPAQASKEEVESAAAESHSRALKSHMWGDTIKSSSTDLETRRHPSQQPVASVTLHMPIPAFVRASESHHDYSNFAEKQNDTKAKSPLPLKRKVNDEQEAANGTHQDAELQDHDAAAIKSVQMRALRKANKQSRKSGAGALDSQPPDGISAVAGGDGDAHHQQPIDSSRGYDYETAPSVLHAKRPPKTNGSAKAAANPYVKGDAAPAGMKRAQNPGVGRSHTFKE